MQMAEKMAHEINLVMQCPLSEVMQGGMHQPFSNHNDGGCRRETGCVGWKNV